MSEQTYANGYVPLSTELEREMYRFMARYEAGKAVVGLALGLELEEVVSGEDGGYTRFLPDRPAVTEDVPEDSLSDAGRDLVVLVAGHLAAARDEAEEFGDADAEPFGADDGRLSASYRHGGRADWDPDLRAALRLAEAVHAEREGEVVSGDPTLWELLRAELLAEAILDRFWPEVQVLADAICVTGLTGNQVRRLIGEIGWSPPCVYE